MGAGWAWETKKGPRCNVPQVGYPPQVAPVAYTLFFPVVKLLAKCLTPLLVLNFIALTMCQFPFLASMWRKMSVPGQDSMLTTSNYQIFWEFSTTYILL